MKKYYFHYLPPVLNPDPNKLAVNLFTPWSVVEALAPTATWAGGSPAPSKRKLHNHGSRKEGRGRAEYEILACKPHESDDTYIFTQEHRYSVVELTEK